MLLKLHLFSLSETALLVTSSTTFSRFSLLLNLILSLSGFFCLNNVSEKRGMAQSKELGSSHYVSQLQMPEQFPLVLSKVASSFPVIGWVLRHMYTPSPLFLFNIPRFFLIMLNFWISFKLILLGKSLTHNDEILLTVITLTW